MSATAVTLVILISLFIAGQLSDTLCGFGIV